MKHISIRTLLSVLVNQDLELEQLDVKTALAALEKKELYMSQPKGFDVKGKEDVGWTLIS